MFKDNARLLAIEEHGAANDYGDVTVAGDAIWTGSAPCYLKRVERREISGGETTDVKTDTLFVRRLTGAPTVETVGERARASTILVEDQRQTPYQTRRFAVIGAELRAAGTEVDSIRLELSDEWR